MPFIENNTNGVVYMTAPNIDAKHAFTTRIGGVSTGIYESLNLGQSLGDDRALVRENYGILCGALGITCDDIVGSHQVHGAQVRVVTKADRGDVFVKTSHIADGLITIEHGVALAVFSGDCVPILLHDPVSGAIGAVHAGWRGTVADIAGAAVSRMSEEYGCNPADIRAAIGPCISKCCFETDSDVTDALHSVLPEAAGNCYERRGEKYMTDLKEANRLLLQRAGVHDISISDECTSCRSDKYWSHRRTKGKRGSQAAIIFRHCGRDPQSPDINNSKGSSK